MYIFYVVWNTFCPLNVLLLHPLFLLVFLSWRGLLFQERRSLGSILWSVSTVISVLNHFFLCPFFYWVISGCCCGHFEDVYEDIFALRIKVDDFFYVVSVCVCVWGGGERRVRVGHFLWFAAPASPRTYLLVFDGTLFMEEKTMQEMSCVCVGLDPLPAITFSRHIWSRPGARCDIDVVLSRYKNKQNGAERRRVLLVRWGGRPGRLVAVRVGNATIGSKMVQKGSKRVKK